MQRMFPALVIAVFVHAIVLTADTDWLMRSKTIAPHTPVLTMQLIERTPYYPPATRSLAEEPPILPPIPKNTVFKNPTPKKQTVKLKTVAPKPKPVVRPPLDKRPSTLPPAHPAPMPVAAKSDSEPYEPPPLFNPVRTTALSTLPPGSEPPVKEKEATETGNKGTDVATVVVATPRYNDNPPPDYPAIARKRGYEGTVVLEVFVNEDGTVGDLRIVQSSQHRLLDRSAVKAVKHWQFEPGGQAGQTMAMWVRVPVDFRLQ